MNSGVINFADPYTVRDIQATIADANIRGISFKDIEIRSLSASSLDVQNGTVQVAKIPAGSTEFEIRFTGNGESLRMLFFADDIYIGKIGSSLHLLSRFDVAADSKHLLSCPFASLSDAFPFALDVDIVGTDPPLPRRRAAGKP